MSRREIAECDECGEVMEWPVRWGVEHDPLDRAPESYDFCSRKCLLKHLSEGMVIPAYNSVMGYTVPMGSFAWAMQRVKDGARVRRRGQGFILSRALWEEHGLAGMSLAHTNLDAEWEEVP